MVEAAFSALGLSRMAVSKAALREGALYDMLGRGGADDPREASVAALVQRYGIDDAQAARVQATALMLFDRVAAGWKLDDDMRRMLAWAARLHELGLAIAHSQYQLHGAYVLQHSDIAGFSLQEQQVLAALVRSHRRKVPGKAFDAVCLRPVRGTELDIGLRHVDTAEEALGKIFALASDADVADVWVGGRQVASGGFVRHVPR